MGEGAGKHIGEGLAWMGFWLMIGLANFGESPIKVNMENVEQKVQEVVDDS